MSEQTQREVVLKMSAKTDPTLTAPYQNLAQSAKAAGRDIDHMYATATQRAQHLGQTAKGAAEAMTNSFRTAGREADAYAGKLSNLERGIQRIGKAGVSNKSLNVKKSETLVDSLSERLGVPAGLTKLTAAFSALALTVKGTDLAMRGYYNAIERGQFSSTVFGQNLRGLVERNVPIYGEFLRHGTHPAGETTNSVDNAVANAYRRMIRWRNDHLPWVRRGLNALPLTWNGARLGDSGAGPETAIDPSRQVSDAEREYLLFHSQQRVALAHAEAALRGQTQRRQAGLLMQMETQRGERESALALARAQAGITTRAGAARHAAIENVQGQFGYGRQQRLEDEMLTLGFRERRARAAAESAAVLNDRRDQEAERQARHFAGRHQAALSAEQQLRQQLEPFSELKRVNDAILAQRMAGKDTGALELRQKELQAKTGGKTVEEELRMRRQLQELEAQTAQARDQANASLQQALDLRLQKNNAIADANKRQTDLLNEQVQSLQHLRQAEQMRTKGLQEELGLEHPLTLRRHLAVSRKFKAGQQLTFGEIEFMKAHRNVHEAALQQLGAQRSTRGPMAGMIQEIMRNTGQFERGKALEKQLVEVKHALTVNINANEAVVKQMNDALTRAFGDFRSQLDARLKNMLDALNNAGMAQSRAMFRQH